MLVAMPVIAAEQAFDFSNAPLDQTPPGFRSVVAGAGKPGAWKVILDDVPPLLAPLSSKAPAVAKRAVLAQASREAVDNHFPILIFEGDEYKEFKLTTRFKVVGGALEQMAGAVFRYQNESNFYVVRASVLGKNFRCYRVENGVIKPPIGPEVEIAKGVWHELSVQCEGNRIVCALDGQELIKLVDNASAGKSGKVGFWTKSDSVSYFADARISYSAREMPAQTLVRAAMKDFPKVIGIQVYATRSKTEAPAVVASTDEKDLGKPGGAAEQDVALNARAYYAKGRDTVSVTLPLRDRNGEAIAAVRVQMKSFPGQTQDNALVRARPIVQLMQARVQSLDDLLE